MTSSWFFLSTLNYDARSTAHQTSDCGPRQMADSRSFGDTHLGSIKGHAALATLTAAGDKVIGRATDQRLKGEDGRNYIGRRTAMFKERKSHHVMVSKQQPKYYDESIWYCRPGRTVGIATGYGLDGPGIESCWGRYFAHLSRPFVGPTQPPVQWVPGIYRG